MTGAFDTSALHVRVADPDGSDSTVISRLVEEYLRRTEVEKALQLRGLAQPNDVELPERYREEVEHPVRAYRGAVVYIAEFDRSPVGVLVVQQTADAREIKRVWVAPDARGHGAGSRMIDAAVRDASLPTRLTVWDWRRDAIALYESHGFVVVHSWEERPRLICMERPPSSS